MFVGTGPRTGGAWQADISATAAAMAMVVVRDGRQRGMRVMVARSSRRHTRNPSEADRAHGRNFRPPRGDQSARLRRPLAFSRSRWLAIAAFLLRISRATEDL